MSESINIPMGTVSFSVTIGGGGSVSRDNLYSILKLNSVCRAVTLTDIQPLWSWMDRASVLLRISLPMEAEGKIS